MTHSPDAPSLDLLARYLRGDVAVEERHCVTDWLAGDPTRATELEDLRTILSASRSGRVWDLDRVWSGIQHDMGTGRRAPRFVIAERRGWSSAARAASVALAIGSGVAAALVLGRQGETPVADASSVIETARAQRLSLRLPDSTLVVLAPESRLEIASDYGKPVRRVRLEGQAAFTVVHDERRPFSVETRGAVARDLGTYFAVRAYVPDSAAEIAVAEGIVAVGRTGTSDSLVVRPGEVARVGADGRLGVVRGAGLEPYFGWTDGSLAFEKAQLREVAEQMERWYDVEVRVADSAHLSRRVTASFQNEPPDRVLELVAALVGLESVLAGDVYTLRARQ
jgi:transmembrane sensor